MNISVQKLLSKIEDELALAKQNSSDESLREKVYSIKTLCELILDEKPISSGTVIPTASPSPLTIQTSMSISQPKKLVSDDGANGESLFDF